MTRELPIFPLPIVLFPGAPQPLHIFEPRYRQLLADCVAADRRFGIAYVTPSSPSPCPPQPGPGVDAGPKPGDVGCVAFIRSTQPLPDGRSNILIVGERRFVLLGWLPAGRPYRLAQVEEFDDEPVDASEAATVVADVRGGFHRLAQALGVLTGREDTDVELPADPQLLSFQVAAALEVDAEMKRGLQALRSTTVRLRHLAALLEPLAADAERRAAVRQQAKGNGKGGVHPQIEPAA
jgi:ATP-dependent Lon protease